MQKFFFAFISLVFCFQITIAQLTVTSVAAAQVPTNVLRYEVSCNLSENAVVHVQYGYQAGPDTIWNRTQAQQFNTGNAVVQLVGLRANTTYSYRLIATNAGNYVESATLTFTTAALPSNLTFTGTDSVRTQANLDGYLIFNSTDTSTTRVVQAIDREGEVVWYQDMNGNSSPSADGACQQFAYRDRDAFFLLNCTTLFEWRFDAPGFQTINVNALRPNMHPYHKAFRNANGNITCLVAVVDTIDKSSVGGSANAIVVGPGILEFDSTSNVIWSWSAFDHYDPLQSPAPGGYWTPKFGPEAIDWMHVSGFFEDQDRNYMLNFRDLNQVVKVSRNSGNPLWTCGDNGNIEIMVADSFLKPASIGLANNGNYLMMDNGSQGSVSRAIDWWIDWGYAIPTMMIDRAFPLPTAYFDTTGGSTERLPGNHTLVASPKGLAMEFDISGNERWAAWLDRDLGQAYFVDDFYNRATLSYNGPTLFCITDTAASLSASPDLGYWSGPGINNGIFNAATAGGGTHTLYYQYGGDSLAISVMVDADPNCTVPVDAGMAWNLHFAAFPNPFTDQLQLCYTLVEKADMRIELYSLDGRRLARIYEGVQSPGDQNLELDVSSLNLPTGPVLLRLQTSDGGQSSRLLMHGR